MKDPFSLKIFGSLAMDEDTAAVAVLVRLLRSSPTLRDWLWDEFAQSEKTRARVAQYLEDGVAPTSDGNRLLAWFSDEYGAYAVEQERLKKMFFGRLAERCYGGLTRGEIIRLIRHHQAGTVDFGAFTLVQAWQKQGSKEAGNSLRLMRAGQVFLAEALGRSDHRLLSHLIRAREMFSGRPNGRLERADYGYAGWWKLSILLYMLNHPRPSYATRDFRRHLVEQRLRVDPQDIRRFCKLHGIARDMRAGRPRKLAA